MENIIEKIYKELYKKYGKPKEQWGLWCKRPKTFLEREEIIIGAILTQRTNWKNVEIAMNNLKKKKLCSLKGIYKCYQKNKKELFYLIRPAGFYQQKTEYLFNLIEFILKNYQNIKRLKKQNLSKLRKELLNLKGIGPETADSILLYALDKPIFVIDTYTKKLVKKYQLSEIFDYHFLQKLFEKNLKKDYHLYQDFHALIVIDAKLLMQKIE